MPIDPLEQQLITRLLKGDTRAARQLYSLLSPRLSKFFTAKLADVEDIDELIQDTFLHLLDALPLFRFQSSLTTFTLSIAHHELADYWRKRYAKRLIRAIPIIKDLPTNPHSSERTSLAIHHAIETAYSCLKPYQVQLLRWKYEDNQSIQEIAQKLGWSYKAVEAQLYRARKAFQLAYIEPDIYD